MDDPTSNYLVYCPLSYDTEEDDWLLDVKLYAEEFRADQISMWMDEMQIPETPALRKAFKQYRKIWVEKNIWWIILLLAVLLIVPLALGRVKRMKWEVIMHEHSKVRK